MLLELAHVNKTYAAPAGGASVNVLTDINLQLAAGEALASAAEARVSTGGQRIIVAIADGGEAPSHSLSRPPPPAKPRLIASRCRQSRSLLPAAATCNQGID